MNIRRIILIILLVSPVANFSQIFAPPYKAKFFFPNGNYLGNAEKELDNNGKIKFIVIGRNKNHIVVNYDFLKDDGGIIDAVNSSAESFLYDKIFNYDFDEDKEDEFILCQIYKKRYGIIYVDFVNGIAQQKEIYSIKRFNDKNSAAFNYSVVQKGKKKYFLIFFNTVYPRKHDFRLIIALDGNTFKPLWKKVIADYIFSVRYFKSQPEYFYYTTVSYLNGLCFSNGTFYRTKMFAEKKYASKHKFEYFVDTAFTKRTFPFPDTSAKDYSEDSRAYLVKMDFNGNFIYRKCLGGKFVNVKFIDYRGDNKVLLGVNDRAKAKTKIFMFYPANDSLKFLFELKGCYDNLFVRGNKLFVSLAQKLLLYSVETGEIDSVQTEGEIFAIEGTEKYYGSKAPDEDKLIIYDTAFKKIAEVKVSNFYRTVKYFKILKAFVIIKSKGVNKYFRLEKKSLFERITPRVMERIVFLLIFIIMVLVTGWLYVMIISKKKIEERNRQLQRANKEIEEATTKLIRTEKLAALGTIAGAIAHQLNSPIGAIINSAERLEKKIKGDENLELIKKASLKTKKIVERFLNATRPSEGERSVSNLEKAIEEFKELFWHHFTVLGIEIKVNVTGECKINIPQTELNEILMNLIFNAKDAVLEGEKEEKLIELFAIEEKDKCRITIKDNGPGFAEVILANKFEPFLSTKEKGKGTGLGLWIVNKLIKKYNGSMEIGNTKNGAFVKIELPLLKK